jgi:hypothetical protein
MTPAITLENITDNEGNDFVLAESESAWITVRNLSVYIRDTGEGVTIAIYPKGKEADDSIDETWVLFNEGEE